MTALASESVFLTAEWRKLAIANFEVSPDLLSTYVPTGTEIDMNEGKCFVSLVAFMFENTKVKGISIPFHDTFEEVNLRFYVRRKNGGTWNRGVVFIQELVPKFMVSLVANILYNEPYKTVPFRHNIQIGTEISAAYEWKQSDYWNRLSVTSLNTPLPIVEGTEEYFITQHFWGYSKKNQKETKEYEVEHPVWDHYPVISFDLDVQFGDLYGPKFKFLESESPHSVLLAEGSEILLRDGVYI